MPTKKRRLPREILLRRLISSTILLIGLVVIVLVIVSAVKAMLSMVNSQNLAQSATEMDTEQSVGIPNCVAAELDVTLTTEESVISQGSSATISISLENSGDEACWMNTSSLQILVSQTDQENGQTETIWPGTECVSDWARPLLLSPGVSWDSSITWSGKVYSDCEILQVSVDGQQTDEVAATGTYAVAAYFEDEPVGQSMPLIVQ